MSKSIVLGLALFLIASPVFADTFTANLHYGSTGTDVTALQEFLIDQQVMTGKATGNFYSLTLKAVKLFQSKEGISPVSGYVGPVTRGVINGLLAVQAPDSEGDATTTKPTVDLSTLTPPNNVQLPINGATNNNMNQSTNDRVAAANVASSSQLLAPYGILDFDNSTQWPVQVVTTSTTANIALGNDYANWGDVVFQGQTILTKQGNELPISYEGEVFPVHSRSWYQLTGLSPNTVYSYQFVFHETGRADTVVSKSFKTKIDVTPQINNLKNQITQIEDKLQNDIAAVHSNPIPVGDQNGQIQNLTDQANISVRALQEQINRLQNQ